MNRGVVFSLGSIIVGCIGLIYTIANNRGNETHNDVEDESTLVEEIFEEVKEYMNRKTNAVGERIQFHKDILASRSNRLTIGLVAVGLGVGLIASAYIPIPNLI